MAHYACFAEKSVQFQPHYWHKKIIFSKIKISVCTKCEISNIFDTKKVFLNFFPRTFPLAHSMAHYACFAKQSVQFQPHYWHKKIIFSTMKIMCANCWVMTPHFGHKKLFFSKLYVRNSEKFSTFTQWHTMHLLPKGLNDSLVGFWETAHLAIFPTKLFHIPVAVKK